MSEVTVWYINVSHKYIELTTYTSSFSFAI